MRQKSNRGVFPLLITFVWAAAMLMLLDRHYGVFPKAGRPHVAVPEDFFKEQWMGIYRMGEKIGYASSLFEKEGDGYSAKETAFMKIKVMGIEKDIKMKTDTLLTDALKMKSFVFIMDSDISIKVEGTVKGRELIVGLDAGGAKSGQSIPLKEAPYSSLSVIPELMSRGMEAGMKIELPIVETSTLTQDVMSYDVEGKEKIFSMGSKVDAFKLRGSFKGAEMNLWVDGKGEVLRQESMGFTFIKETKEDALKIGRPSVDLIAQVSIPVDMKIPDGAGYLKVRLKGISFNGLDLNGGTQKLTGDVLEIKKIPLDEIRGAPLADEGDFLKGDILIQSKDLAIIKLSKEISGRARKRAEAARLIYEWVYKSIEKAPTITIPSATEVLRSKRGDCNEHTTLYTALSRAAGIPTRMAVGLVHKEGFFYYHAWPEVYLGVWVSVDPTLGQFPADATHIRLFTGGLENQLKLGSVIGRLQIEGLEAR
jgi:hypothetical protein